MITTEWKQAVYEPSEGNVAFCTKRKTRGGEKNKALFFVLILYSPSRSSQKYRVHLAWLMKRLLCRLERKQDCQQ